MGINMKKWRFRRSNCWTCVLVFGLTMYVVVGAVMFHILEFSGEQRERKSLRKSRTNFLENNECVTGMLKQINFQ